MPKITDYEQAKNILDSDLMLIETSDGTKTVTVGKLSEDMTEENNMFRKATSGTETTEFVINTKTFDCALCSNTISKVCGDAIEIYGIDESINDYAEGSAFAGCTALTTVDLPSATTIGAYAFEQCTALTTVDLPSATTIGAYAFGYSNSRKSNADTIIIGSTSNACLKIVSSAFKGLRPNNNDQVSVTVYYDSSNENCTIAPTTDDSGTVNYFGGSSTYIDITFIDISTITE